MGIAQGQNRPHFLHLSVDEGLSNGRITAMIQDSLGFIWIGTKNGLNRYDGKFMKIYNQQNSMLTSGDISSLAVDEEGILWVGTIGGGLCRYNEKKDSFYCYKSTKEVTSPIPSKNVNTFVQTTQDEVWIGTDKGLYKYSKKEDYFTRFPVSISPFAAVSNNVQAICKINATKLLVGTNGAGLFVFDMEKQSFIPFDYSACHIEQPPEFINSIIPYNGNQWLIGTNGNGLLLYDQDNNQLTNFFLNTAYENIAIIRTIHKDNENRFWIGTDGQGVLSFMGTNSKPVQIDHYFNDSRIKSSLSNNTVNVVFQDNQDNIWFGTAWKGIDIIKKESNHIRFYNSDAERYNTSPILSVLKYKCELWMGTDGNGLSIYSLANENECNLLLQNEYIQCIVPSINGGFLVGTFSNGLLLLDDNKKLKRQYKREPNTLSSLPYNDVRSIVETESGNLWIGTWGGGLSFFDFDTEKFKTYRYSPNTVNSLSSNEVLSVVRNSDGTLWVTTFGGGINYFNPQTEKFKRISLTKNTTYSSGADYVFALVKDSDSVLWLGTKDGLFRYNVQTKTSERIKIGNSIDSNTVMSLILDDKGLIWMGTKAGIYNYDPVRKKSRILIDTAQEFHINSVCKDEDGVLYFGGANRVDSFHPSFVDFEEVYPNVLITDLKLFNERVLVGENELLKTQIFYQKEIILKHNLNVLTFSFVAMDYPFSNHGEFAIKMEGFEEGWRNIGKQNSITFNKLPSGDYTFMVKLVQDGVFMEPVTLKVKILPPFWKTWYAYSLYAIVFFALLWGFHSYSVRWAAIKNKLKMERLHREQEDKLHELKQQFFTNISHEIRTPLTLIINPLENLLKKGGFTRKQQKQLMVIRYNTKRLLNLVNELLNFRQLESGNINLKSTQNDLVVFSKEIYLSYVQLAKNKNINYRFKSTEEEIWVWFDKFQLEMAIHNLLSNAFKFTNSEGTIQLILGKGEDLASIRISDTGKGIRKEKIPHIFKRFYQKRNYEDMEQGFGIGLSIVKDIVEMHSGTVHVKSKFARGSKFTITLPLGNAHFSEGQMGLEHETEQLSHCLLLNSIQRNQEQVINDEFSGTIVLVIEDNTHIRHYLNEILSENYVVFEAKNGKEGLEKAKEVIPDVIISDVLMPDLDGISLCHRLKTDVCTSHIPIILLTARTLSSHKIDGYQIGADAYLTKPFDENVLKSRVENLLNNRKLLREKFIKDDILKPKEVTLNSPDHKFLSQITQLIEDNIDNTEFSVDQLAKDMAMSHSNVYKKMKALTGLTLVKFLKDFRLKRAAQVLKQQNLPIIDVAFMVGYTDRRHFSREFKKKFKLSPSAYSKKRS